MIPEGNPPRRRASCRAHAERMYGALSTTCANVCTQRTRTAGLRVQKGCCSLFLVCLRFCYLHTSICQEKGCCSLLSRSLGHLLRLRLVDSLVSPGEEVLEGLRGLSGSRSPSRISHLSSPLPFLPSLCGSSHTFPARSATCSPALADSSVRTTGYLTL